VKNQYPDKNIRIVVTGGISADGLTPGKPSIAVLFTKAHAFPASFYTQGVNVRTYCYERSYPEVKSLNYLTAVIELQKAKKLGALEIVYTDRIGRILEGTTSNFFTVVNQKLLTPKDGILFGITRRVVLDLARKMHIPVLETDLFLSEIPLFDECFITASNKEIMPVVQIDDWKIGTGRVGAITKKLREAYRQMTLQLPLSGKRTFFAASTALLNKNATVNGPVPPGVGV